MSNKQPIELIAFDMFGTLVHNDEAEWVVTMEAISAEQRLGMDGAELRRVWSRYERNFRKTRSPLSGPIPAFLSYWEAWRDAFVDTFRELGLAGDPAAAASRCVDDLCSRAPFPDAKRVLPRLAGKRPLGLLSNADDRFLLGVVENQGWRFDKVLSSEGARAYKPDRRIFEAFSTMTGVPVNRILYVGDSPYDDVHGAKEAGMRVVLVNRTQDTPGRTPSPEGVELLTADHEVASLDELESLLSEA